jgi:hypothetical protein
MIVTSSGLRRGTVAVYATISLTIVIMVLGLTLDAGLMFAKKRHVQAIADAAALAGAADLYKNYSTNGGNDPSPYSAKTSALAIASSNGYTNDGATSTVEVRSFGATYLSGPNIGQSIDRGRIEVNITYYQPRYFSLIFGSGATPIKARAVAAGTWGVPKFGMLMLEPTGTGLNVTGQGSVNVTSGIVVVNSTDASAVNNKNNGVIQTTQIDIAGGLNDSGTIIADSINTGVPASPDPLATVPAPTEPPAAANPVQLKDVGKNTDLTTMLNKLVTSGQLTLTKAATFLSGSGKVYLLQPGTYDSKITKMPSGLGNGDLVIFGQASSVNNGIYYLKESGFSSQGASLLMHPDQSGGMMFYNSGTGVNDKISISGNPDSIVNLSGITSGTYTGFFIFQNRLATQQISITGNGEFNIQGTLYAPNADLSLTGNGANQTMGSQVISRTITVSGNGVINVELTTGKTAPQRFYRLVQ